MKKIILALFCTLLAFPAMAQKNVYNFKVKDANERTVKLKDYKGKVLLIVNTATKCGFTPQYEALQKLYDTYKAQGLVILDFPCNQFGEQAPGTLSEIKAFCTGNYGVTFPQFDKIEVNGKKELPLYTYLKAQQGFKGFDTNTTIGKFLDEKFSKQDPNYAKNPSIKWNFTKFLIDREGHVVDRFEPTADMKDVEAGIRAALKVQ
ncbi:glutathione peroxidase [Prevotella intermedia]|uniref:Glutathione peroxidase n=1 Tax=Prevotella intermedia TaxID=28131 RepID=A0A425VPM0_PREIN|nr:glutathione peroxidase [Prevotella intermedia]RQE04169.1 glutathione peroxidase [Prevotella intermedia]RRF87491.1 glutathione peroxidase [Prevotella intermedia]